MTALVLITPDCSNALATRQTTVTWLRIINLSLLFSNTMRPVARTARCHGIDFKNPFTMSKRGQIPQSRATGARKPISSSSEMLVEPIGIEPMTSSLQS